MIFASKSHGGLSGDWKNLRRENLLAGLLLVFAFVLRLIFIFHYKVNSDETQHLHVVWAWAHGLLPYRDVFDNHSPLFSFLWSPLFRLIGERPDIIVWMRLTELPCFVLSFWAVYRLGSAIFDRRTGWWGAILAALFPLCFCCSLEFRPDGLWACCWFWALTFFVEGRPTLWRSLLVGFLLGVAMAISMKTILMLLAFGAGLLVAGAAAGQNGRKFSASGLCRHGLAGLGGLLIMPAAVVIFFASQNALQPLYYGTIGHNLLARSSDHVPLLLRSVFFLFALIVLICVAFIITRRSRTVDIGWRRTVILVATGIYWLLLVCFWPLLQREHYLPFYPLLMVLLAGLIFSMPRSQPAPRLPKFFIPAALVAVELFWLTGVTPPWKNKVESETRFLSQVLSMTSPTDTIMDQKGETVFRPRPFYFALEKVTARAIQRGDIADDIPQHLIASNTCVAVTRKNSGYSRQSRSFIEENYLKVGQLRVAGVYFHPAMTVAVPFDVVIPARYAVVMHQGVAMGQLDGEPYLGPLFLAAGHHEYLPALGESPMGILWAQAVERNFLPPEFKKL